MLITERFVLLNFPKTGSSFCRNALKDAHVRRCQRLGRFDRYLHRCTLREELTVTIADPSFPFASQHGAAAQIPAPYRKRQKVTVMRNPFDLFRSFYEYGWWKEYPGLDIDKVSSLFPSFPELSPIEYHALGEQWVKQYFPNVSLGYLTTYFINMFFSNPKLIFGLVSQDNFASNYWMSELKLIHFMRNANLRHDLVEFLTKNGFVPNDVEFIRSAPLENVSQKSNFEWSTELVERIADGERLLICMLEHLGLDVSMPKC